jgi:hypothetical protein
MFSIFANANARHQAKKVPKVHAESVVQKDSSEGQHSSSVTPSIIRLPVVDDGVDRSVVRSQVNKPASTPQALIQPFWRDPIFLGVSASACLVSWYFPPSAAAALPVKVFASTQFVSSIALMITLSGLAAENMGRKLTRISVGTGLFSLQFTVLALAGVDVAWGGAVAMGVACLRSFVFSKMQNHSQRDRNVVAGMFIASGTLFMLTGFGITPALAPWQKIALGDKGVLATMLPMVASISATVGNSMPKMRYARPLLTCAGLINCIYNGFFSGAIGHLVNEIAGIVIHVRQFFVRDFPPPKRNGDVFSFRQRWLIYIDYMSKPRLPEDHISRG